MGRLSDHDTYDLAVGPRRPSPTQGSRMSPPEYDRPPPEPEPEPETVLDWEARDRIFRLMQAREAAAVAERAAHAAHRVANRAAQDASDAVEAAQMMERARVALERSLEPPTAPEPVQPTGPVIMACARCGSHGIAINPDRSTVWYCPAGYGCQVEATDADL